MSYDTSPEYDALIAKVGYETANVMLRMLTIGDSPERIQKLIAAGREMVNAWGAFADDPSGKNKFAVMAADRHLTCAMDAIVGEVPAHG